jgi:hypothetical protein
MKIAPKKIILFAGIAAGALLVGVIGWRIVAKIVQGAAPRRPTVVTVGLMPLKKQALEKTLSFRGIVEGDPQVKVYPGVAGKFAGNAAAEGDFVAADQVLAWVGRDVVGQVFEPAPVRAPVAGMVKRLYYTDRGAPVTVDRPVAEIANPDRVKIVLTVGEADLGRVKTGMEAVIRSPYDPALALKAAVSSVTPFVDSETFSGNIIVRAGNPGRAAAVGMSATVDIVYARADAFAVPVAAVQQDMEAAFIYLDVDDTARRTVVTTGYVKNGLVEISGAFREGDIVVTDGSFKLFDGAKIAAAGSRGADRRPAPSGQ